MSTTDSHSKKNDISFIILPDPTDQDLELGHRRLLLREIAKLDKTAAASPPAWIRLALRRSSM
jgi:hypothetical protein